VTAKTALDFAAAVFEVYIYGNGSMFYTAVKIIDVSKALFLYL